MLKLLRNTAFTLLRCSGLPWLIRATVQRDKVTIVAFHDIAAAHAERVFPFLARTYNLIGLADYLEARRTGDSARLPKKALIITLDDGHIGNHRLLPLLKQHRIPVTIFLCSGLIDTNRHYWFRFEHPQVSVEALKAVPNREKLERLAALGFSPEREFERPQALGRDQLREMAGAVDFQGHSHLHPCLPTCGDDEARTEVAGSKRVLEQRFGLRIDAFAYPNGDYSDRDIALVREAGYACAVTMDPGFNTLQTDVYRLRRIGIDDGDPIAAVCVKASGLWALLRSGMRGGRKSGYMVALRAGAEATPKTSLRR